MAEPAQKSDSKNSIDEATNVKGVYEQIAGHFSNTRRNTWPWITEFITSFPKDSTLYDIGCGNGRNMMESGYNFIGIDNCDSFLNICRERGLDVRFGDMTELPFKDDEQANALIVIASFHHLSTVDRRIKALSEMKRVIKDDGKILLSVWSKEQPPKSKNKFEYGDNVVNWTSNNNVFERYYYIFQLDEIKELFERVGLKIVKYDWDYGNHIFILEKK